MVTDAVKDTDVVEIEMSVIIPTYNRAERLRACLEALSRQTLPATDFEVIVVVDGSTDGTREMLANLVTPYTLCVICQQNSGQHIARNRGADNARGSYCLFLDDDIVADPRLVAEHLRAQRQCEGVVAIGQITITVPADADWFLRCFAEGWSGHYARLNQSLRSPLWIDCYGGNVSVSRAAFLKAGGFAADLRREHDVELGYRLGQQGLSFVYVSNAIGTQDECKGIRELTADAEKRGAIWVKLYQRHPSMLPELLGSFSEASRRQILLHRILLALDISPRLLAFIGPLLGRRLWTYSWYRILRTYCNWRGVRRAIPDRDTWRRLTRGTPILMYHAFGGANEPPSRFVLPVHRFAQQMAWLKWMGYCVLNLEEFLRYRREYRLPPVRSVVITIDDGYTDARTLAYPILHRYGFPATTFLVSGKVGACNDWAGNSELRGRTLLSWSNIRELLKGGMQFGAHSRSHPVLTSLSSERVQEELEGARTDLERELQVPIRTVAYPYGEYNSTTQAIAEQAGFLGSCSAHSGLNTLKTPLHALRRIEIRGTDSLAHFALKLWLGHSHMLHHRRNSR